MRKKQMNEFDLKAAGWDTNPMHVERSEAVAAKILEMIEIKPGMRVLEYGAGTGITSFILSDNFDEIVLMDDSGEMVKMIDQKIARSRKDHMKSIKFNLEKDTFSGKRFDLIYTQMVLHHINDTGSIIKKFYDLLNENGSVAIADLYEEDGMFHGEGFTGHNGFNINELKHLLETIGFKDVREEQCYEIKKDTANGTRCFPVFLMTGHK